MFGNKKKKLRNRKKQLVKKKNNAFGVELKGSNWFKKNDLPVAIFFSFNPWKRDIFARFFPQYRVAFVRGNNIFSIKSFMFTKDIMKTNKVAIIKWGEKPLPYFIRVLIYFKKMNVLRIEDGFLRSLNVGVLHTRPASICVDKLGIYFNSSRISHIENLLNFYDLSEKKDLLEKAKKAISLIKETNLFKYYDYREVFKRETFKRTRKYSILVIGQVEADASIKYGANRVKTNSALILKAKADYPFADIYFRPHPDYMYNNRSGDMNNDDYLIQKHAVVLDKATPLFEVLSKVDHVYTITSLVGLEALIFGKKVTCYGKPFYSGWGLTEDKTKVKRRYRKRTLEELFAIAYLLYPKYFHLISDEEVCYEETAYYFLVEGLKYKQVHSIETDPLFIKLKNSHLYEYPPFEVLKYISSKQYSIENDTETIFNMIKKNFRLRDYPQISYILINSANYDLLVKYSNYCLLELKEINKYINNTMLLDNFLYSLSYSQFNSNGRVIIDIPDLIDPILSIHSVDNLKNSVIKNYLVCCSNSLQYDLIDSLIKKIHLSSRNHISHFNWHISKNLIKLIDFLSSKPLENSFNKTLLQAINARPSRSERNSEKRHQLTNIVLSEYINYLNSIYSTEYDLFLNKSLSFMTLGKVLEAEKQLKSYIDLIGDKNVISVAQLSRRLNDLLRLTNFFIKKKRFEILDKYFYQIQELNNQHENEDETGTKDTLKIYNLKIRVISTILNYYKFTDNLEEFLKIVNTSNLNIKGTDKVLELTAKFLREKNFFKESLKFYRKLYTKTADFSRKMVFRDEISKLSFVIESGEILNSVPQPKIPQGVIFIASQTCYNSLALMLPTYLELKKKGYAVICLTQGMLFEDPTNIEYIDKFYGVIPISVTKVETIVDLSCSWHIDWKNKQIESGGVNYYQGFYEGLSTRLRKYHIDINERHAYEAFVKQITKSDHCLNVCQQIYNTLVLERNIPVTFVSGNSHVVSYSIFRDFAMSKNHNKLGFINCNVAYESYFSNLGSKVANTMCVTDMTLYPTIRAPFIPRKDQFDIWYEKNKTNDFFLKKANSLIHVNRVGSSSNKKEIEIINFLKKKKAEGKKILCVFGKVPVDLNVPFDGGNAHHDMADWLNHTVKICSKLKNIILLVKPHPHELRPEIALDLISGFNDLITEEVTENIILLNHKDINSHALVSYLDLAIIYNGSSSLELTAQGVPVIMASYFGKYDYPIDLIYPESREQYEKFIASNVYPAPNHEIIKKAAFLMCYMETDEISITNQYSIRQLTNDRIGIPIWRKDKIDEFIAKGDPQMSLMADRIIEKYKNI